MDKRDPIIVSAVRTPIASFGGALRDVLHEQLASTVMAEVCDRVNFPKEKLGDVYWGVVMTRSDENGLARCAALKAGIPEHVSAVHVGRACCSSMEAIRIASMRIRLGEGEAILAGGGESMSNVSYSIKNARWGLRLRHQELSDGVWDGLFDQYSGLIMGLTAENVAEQYSISREDQDEFAYVSQMRAKKALEEGRFKDEIVPVAIPGKKGKKDVIVDTDQHPRPETTPRGVAPAPSGVQERRHSDRRQFFRNERWRLCGPGDLSGIGRAVGHETKVANCRICGGWCGSKDYGDRAHPGHPETFAADGLSPGRYRAV